MHLFINCAKAFLVLNVAKLLDNFYRLESVAVYFSHINKTLNLSVGGYGG